jgi:putative ABC transport system permease protein
MKFLHLIWCNLKRKKTRTSLTLLSIVVAFMLFGLLAAIQEALVGGVALAGADRLVVREKVSIINLLPESYEARIDRIPGVDFSTHQTWFGGVYQDPKNFFMQNPVEPEKFLKIHPEILLPPDQQKAWLETRTGAIVGRRTAQRFGWKIGDKVPIRSTIWNLPDGNSTWTFDIVGIYDGKDKGTDTTPLFFRYDYFDEARQQGSQNWGKGKVGWYTIRIKDPSQAADVAKRVDAEFENSPNETKTEPEGAFIQAWASQIGNIVFIVAAILGAVFFTILLVTGNTMAQAVRERTGELGVLNLINCLQSIDQSALDKAKLNQLNFYVGECLPKSQNSLVNSLRTWRHNIIAHYNFEAAHDRAGFDRKTPDEPEEIIHSLIEMGFKILEWCSRIQGKATIYQKFAPGKDDCKEVLKRLF